jgi:hypothetical protein
LLALECRLDKKERGRNAINPVQLPGRIALASKYLLGDEKSKTEIVSSSMKKYYNKTTSTSLEDYAKDMHLKGDELKSDEDYTRIGNEILETLANRNYSIDMNSGIITPWFMTKHEALPSMIFLMSIGIYSDHSRHHLQKAIEQGGVGLVGVTVNDAKDLVNVVPPPFPRMEKISTTRNASTVPSVSFFFLYCDTC